MGGRAEHSSIPELNQKGNSEFSSHVKMGDRETNTVQALQFILKQESDFLFRDICQQVQWWETTEGGSHVPQATAASAFRFSFNTRGTSSVLILFISHRYENLFPGPQWTSTKWLVEMGVEHTSLGKILRTRQLSPGYLSIYLSISLSIYLSPSYICPCSRLPLLLFVESLDEAFTAGSFVFYAK